MLGRGQVKMYEVSDKIYLAATVEEATDNIPATIQISRQPLFERSSVFIPVESQFSLAFDCMFKNAPELYKCKECGFKAYLKVNLKVHMVMVHRLKISITLESFRSFSNESYNLSRILKCYNCSECNFTTFSVLVLLRHQLKHHRLKTKQNMSKKKVNGRTSNKLVQKVQTFATRWFKCEECPFMTTCKYRFKDHTHRHHRLPEDDQLFECTQCSFKTVRESKMKWHKLQHDKSREIKEFKCDYCHYRSKNKHLLDSHVMYRHTEEEKVRRFGCTYCPYKAKQRSTLNMHIVAKHTAAEKINWFLCEMCSFRCKRRTHLKQHMLRHSENKLILCELCSAQFKRVGNLKQHVLCKHK